MELSPCVTDADYEDWRSVRIAVLPYERCSTVEELRAQDSPDRLLLVARDGGTVTGSGLAGRADSTDAAFAAPRVHPDHRRRGVGTAILAALAEHCADLGLPTVRAKVDDEESLVFAQRFGFAEVDREVEQVRAVGDEPAPPPPPPGVEVVLGAERPGLWEQSFETFGRRHSPGSPSTPRSRSLPSGGPPPGWATRCSSRSTTVRWSAVPGSSSTPTGPPAPRTP